MTPSHAKPMSVWKRHRMPIILGIIAVLLYLGSIAWMVYGRGPVA